LHSATLRGDDDCNVIALFASGTTAGTTAEVVVGLVAFD
jgi:hypothetical protein